MRLDDGVEEVAVVRDQDHGVRIAAQVLLEPVAGLEVEVVGRLVEQQQPRLAQQQLGQRQAHLPAAREMLGRQLEVRRREAEAAQDGRDAELDRVAVADPEALLRRAVALEQRLVRRRRRRVASARRCSRSCISALRSSSGRSASLASANTVRPECSRPSWGRYPMVRAVGRITSPPSASSSPARMRSSVVLPAPLGPHRPTRSRSPTYHVTWSRSTRSPKRFDRGRELDHRSRALTRPAPGRRWRRSRSGGSASRDSRRRRG